MRVGLNLDEILKATSGNLIKRGQKDFWENFCRDSRMIKKYDFYIPLKGDRFDGHDFIGDAVGKGASASLWAREDLPSELPEDFTLVGVDDTLMALGNMAKFIRKKWKGTIVGITGSAGKTTTKEMVWAGLSGYEPTFKTPGNYNNLVGLPISLLAVEKEHRYGVVEMGMNTPGEIARLSSIAKPDWGIITTIGPAHIGAFNDMDGIVREKGEILNHVKYGAVFPAGFPFFHDIAGKRGLKVVTTGPMGEVELVQWKGNIVIRWEDRKLEFPFSFETLMEAEDFAIAIAFALLMGLDPKEFGSNIRENYRPPEGRGRIYRGAFTIIDDSYNANPSSVKKSIEFLSNYEGERKILIMGDMLELGEMEEKLHREIGEFVAQKGVDIFIVMGRRAFWAGEEAAKKGINVFFIENMMELQQLLEIIVKERDVILVKASRAMRLERVVDFLRRIGGIDAV